MRKPKTRLPQRATRLTVPVSAGARRPLRALVQRTTRAQALPARPRTRRVARARRHTRAQLRFPLLRHRLPSPACSRCPSSTRRARARRRPQVPSTRSPAREDTHRPRTRAETRTCTRSLSTRSSSTEGTLAGHHNLTPVSATRAARPVNSQACRAPLGHPCSSTATSSTRDGKMRRSAPRVAVATVRVVASVWIAGQEDTHGPCLDGQRLARGVSWVVCLVPPAPDDDNDEYLCT